MDPREERIMQLRAAIAAQEAMRSQLGDATVELSLTPLKSLLDSLLAVDRKYRCPFAAARRLWDMPSRAASATPGTAQAPTWSGRRESRVARVR